MPPRILLHGADQYLGRLCVAEAVDAWAVASGSPRVVLVLSGSDSAAVAALAAQHGLESRALKFGAPEQLAPQLADIDVLVNAASPFADSALVLARAAILAGCHGVDLNPEVDVYRQLQPLADAAAAARIALVRSAGPGAAPSVLMVNAALGLLHAQKALAERCVGALRIALQCVADASRSSSASVWRALSRDVTVVRAFAPPQSGDAAGAFTMRPDHVPIGLLERQFDFAVGDGSTPPPHETHIAAAANLVDTLAAAGEVERLIRIAGRVESYVAATTAARVAYPLGAWAASLVVPLAPRRLAELMSASAQLLPDAPGAPSRHTIVLQIEDEERSCIADWRLDTPDFYLTGARCAIAVAEAVAGGQHVGLLSPAQVLGVDLAKPQPVFGRALRDCRLDKRVLQ